MVSSHVMEQDMQSSTACRMSLLIESVCRIASLLLLHPPRIGAWPPLGVPVLRQAHNRVWRPILVAARVLGPLVPVFGVAAVRGALVVVRAAAPRAVALAAAQRPEQTSACESAWAVSPSRNDVLKYLPGRNTGTVIFLTLTCSPARGLRAVRAARCRFSTTPKSAMDTFWWVSVTGR
jgi:hypothetical protein